jgi:hypothetical protein
LLAKGDTLLDEDACGANALNSLMASNTARDLRVE